MELSFFERWPQWLRWLCILPFGVLAYVLVQILNALMPAPDWVVRWFNAFAGPLAFVVVGSLVAPKGRFVVSILLFLLLTIAQGFLASLSATADTDSSTMWWAFSIGVIGAGIAVVLVKASESSNAG